MSDAELREKYAHRFRVHDADGDGFIDERDAMRRAERLLRAVGEPVTSERGRAVLAGARTFWQGVTKFAQVGPEQRLDEAAFVDALERARQAGLIGELVGPSVEAHVLLVDRDGDGVVSVAEFVDSQCACGQDPAAARAAFEALDRDGDGAVTVEEWQQAVMEYYTSTDPAAPGNLVLGLRS
ncbi:EF-hand domain-containing protein [Streptomyces sp. NPDC059649]|uniref:EF-hand domain-containing protein n=1 Tax=Streptomyces sp. NPDC059649 TaxID=3346895 RepID=UPI0036C692D1